MTPSKCIRKARDSVMGEGAREMRDDKDLTAISDFEDKEAYKPKSAHGI